MKAEFVALETAKLLRDKGMFTDIEFPYPVHCSKVATGNQEPAY